jgi:hypothetical protein
MKSDQLEIHLRSPSNETKVFVFEIHNNSIANKWKEHLEKILQTPHTMEKNFCFLGFLHSHRSLAFLSHQLNLVLDRISGYIGEGPWKYGYSIEERMDPEDISFSILNKLHHHFEILIGQIWSVSAYYSCASNEMRTLIHHLNYLVHEIESILHSKIALKERGEIYPFSVISFPDSKFRPQLLEEEDYEFFSLNRPFGSVGLHYAQTGKTFFDAWRDGDKEIGEANINSLRYYSGQFTINWGNGPDESEQKIRKIYKGFFEWLSSQGFSTEKTQYFVDSKGQKQGIGWIEVAKLKNKELTVEETQKIVGEYNDIYKICLSWNDKIIEKTYDYRIEDQTY